MKKHGILNNSAKNTFGNMVARIVVLTIITVILFSSIFTGNVWADNKSEYMINTEAVRSDSGIVLGEIDQPITGIKRKGNRQSTSTAKRTVRAFAKPGAYIQWVELDGKRIFPGGTSYKWIFNKIGKDHSVKVKFENSNSNIHTVVHNGSITGDGTRYLTGIKHGDSRIIRYKPNRHEYLTKIRVSDIDRNGAESNIIEYTGKELADKQKSMVVRNICCNKKVEVWFDNASLEVRTVVDRPINVEEGAVFVYEAQNTKTGKSYRSTAYIKKGKKEGRAEFRYMKPGEYRILQTSLLSYRKEKTEKEGDRVSLMCKTTEKGNNRSLDRSKTIYIKNRKISKANGGRSDALCVKNNVEEIKKERLKTDSVPEYEKGEHWTDHTDPHYDFAEGRTVYDVEVYRDNQNYNNKPKPTGTPYSKWKLPETAYDNYENRRLYYGEVKIEGYMKKKGSISYVRDNPDVPGGKELVEFDDVEIVDKSWITDWTQVIEEAERIYCRGQTIHH